MPNAWIGKIPPHIISKAKTVITSRPAQEAGWKKLKSLKDCFAFRLSNKYRVICWHGHEFIICDHDTYEKKIKTLRARQGHNANRI